MLSGPRTKLLELFSLLVLARGAIGANLTDLEDLASEARILTGSKFGSAIVSKYNLNPQVILSYIYPGKLITLEGVVWRLSILVVLLWNNPSFNSPFLLFSSTSFIFGTFKELFKFASFILVLQLRWIPF